MLRLRVRLSISCSPSSESVCEAKHQRHLTLEPYHKVVRQMPMPDGSFGFPSSKPVKLRIGLGLDAVWSIVLLGLIEDTTNKLSEPEGLLKISNPQRVEAARKTHLQLRRKPNCFDAIVFVTRGRYCIILRTANSDSAFLRPFSCLL